jgi:hypothetical protein
MRQILGVLAARKTRLVKKLKGTRDRKRVTGVKVEGRKLLVEAILRRCAFHTPTPSHQDGAAHELAARQHGLRLAAALPATPIAKPVLNGRQRGTRRRLSPRPGDARGRSLGEQDELSAGEIFSTLREAQVIVGLAQHYDRRPAVLCAQMASSGD